MLYSDDVDDNNDEEIASSSDETRRRQGLATAAYILIAVVEVVRDRPITELTWVESMRDEYITRHKIDGSIAYVDHRISFVAGFMPGEVIGKSAFEYMHQDDVLWSIMAQKQMLENSHGQGVITYRLRCKDGTYVTLRSRGFLEANKETGKVDTFICINTLMSVRSAEVEAKSQRKKLLPLLSGRSPDDVVKTISSNLPPEMTILLKCFINRQILERMLVNIDLTNPDAEEDYLSSTFSFRNEDPSTSDKVDTTESGGVISKKRSGSQLYKLARLSRKGSRDHLLGKHSAPAALTLNETARKQEEGSDIPVECSAGDSMSRNVEPSFYTVSNIFETKKINKSQMFPPNLIRPPPNPLSNFKENELSSELNNGASFDFHSFQPSHSQIENWGYPTSVADLPRSSNVPNDSARHYTPPQNFPSLSFASHVNTITSRNNSLPSFEFADDTTNLQISSDSFQ